MHLTNSERLTEFAIPADWHTNRKRGISAFLRVKDEEEFIRPCLVSIHRFFDEIVIALNNCTDRTPEIIRQTCDELGVDHVRIYDYPFQLHHNGPGHDDIPEDSVHDNAYFYNWTLSKTTRSHACKWDGDMVALDILDMRFARRVLRHNVVSVPGIDLSGEDLAHESRRDRRNREPRFFRVARHTHYRQGPMTQVFSHDHRSRLVTIDEPVFLHFKNVKSLASATKIWPTNWREIPHFQSLLERRERGPLYLGPYPEALREHIVDRAVRYAAAVESLKGQEGVMRSIGDVLIDLRNQGKRGDVVEIGSLRGKTTVFLARIMESLFPENTLHSIDPYTIEGAERSLSQERVSEIESIYQDFLAHTQSLGNHRHHKLSSREAADLLPDGLVFSFIDGEHTYDGVRADFEMVCAKTQVGGVIAIDDYRNRAWPEVGLAYAAILKDRRVKLLTRDPKAAFLIRAR
jgi:hypothetical protein